jgi:adenylylsulfate kinase-like enzyme
MVNMVYSFIGQPCSGKTTLAKMLRNYFIGQRKITPAYLDGDELRNLFGHTSPEHYTKESREKNAQILNSFIAHLSNQGLIIIKATVSAYRETREELKRATEVIEFYVHKSDTREREAFNVKDYELPLDNFVDIDTTNKTPDESFADVLRAVTLDFFRTT